MKLKKLACLFVVCILLVGCGTIEREEKEKTEKEVEKYSLVSTKDRLVFKSEDIYEVVYYENDKIVKVETAIKFKTAAEAEQYYKEESYGNFETISYVYDVFITEETDDYWEDYKDLNQEELKNYMEQAEYEYIS